MSVGYFIIRFKALQPFIDDSCREIKKAFEPAKAFFITYIKILFSVGRPEPSLDISNPDSGRGLDEGGAVVVVEIASLLGIGDQVKKSMDS